MNTEGSNITGLGTCTKVRKINMNTYLCRVYPTDELYYDLAITTAVGVIAIVGGIVFVYIVVLRIKGESTRKSKAKMFCFRCTKVSVDTDGFPE